MPEDLVREQAVGKPPRVSIVAGCFNHAAFVADFLRSVYDLDFDDWELILVDDGSDDDTAQLVRIWLAEHGDARSSVVEIAHSGLPSGPFNAGLQRATGELLAFVSTDDTFESARLTEQVAALDALGSRAGMVYSDVYLMDQAGQRLSGTYLRAVMGIDTPPSGCMFGALLARNTIPGPSVLIRRSTLERVGQFDERLSFEDWDMWLRIAEQFEIGYSGYVAMNYRQYSSSLINQLYDSRRSDYERSTLDLLDKWRHRHGPDRVVVVQRQGLAAWSLYRHNRDRKALPYLLRAAIARPTPRTFGRWMVARLGLDPARVPLQRWRARAHATPIFSQRNPDSRDSLGRRGSTARAARGVEPLRLPSPC